MVYVDTVEKLNEFVVAEASKRVSEEQNALYKVFEEKFGLVVNHSNNAAHISK